MHQGGVEHAAFEMAEYLAAALPQSKTYVASKGGSLLEKNYHFQHLTLPLHSKNPFTIFLNAFRLAKIIKKHNIDIVHARSRAPAWSAWLACKMTGVPFVTTYHAAYKGRSFFKKFYNSIMARGEKVIAISHFIQNHVTFHCPLANVVLIYEGINTDFYQSKRAASAPVLFLPSRLSPLKGIHVAIKALARLTPQYPEIKLLLMRVGKENYLQQIDHLIRAHQLEKHVRFIEPTPDLRPHYEEASIVLMTSVTPEALGRVSLEALSMQRLLIATNLGANPEICIDGVTGFLVKPGSDKDLADKINDCLMMEEARRAKISQKGRAHVLQNFSKDYMHEKTIKLYQSLLLRK